MTEAERLKEYNHLRSPAVSTPQPQKPQKQQLQQQLPQRPQQDEKVDLASFGWTCKVCGQVNDNSLDKCRDCFSNRKGIAPDHTPKSGFFSAVLSTVGLGGGGGKGKNKKNKHRHSPSPPPPPSRVVKVNTAPQMKKCFHCPRKFDSVYGDLCPQCLDVYMESLKSSEGVSLDRKFIQSHDTRPNMLSELEWPDLPKVEVAVVMKTGGPVSIPDQHKKDHKKNKSKNKNKH
jgi:hypothetical protein